MKTHFVMHVKGASNQQVVIKVFKAGLTSNTKLSIEYIAFKSMQRWSGLLSHDVNDMENATRLCPNVHNFLNRVFQIYCEVLLANQKGEDNFCWTFFYV